MVSIFASEPIFPRLESWPERLFSKKNVLLIFINSALLRVRVENAKIFIVDGTHPGQANGQLVPLKHYNDYFKAE